MSISFVLISEFCVRKGGRMYSVYCSLRDSRKLKDVDVSKATGITRSTFTDWKTGRSKPGIEKLQKIADFFGVPVDYLITGEMPQQEGYYLDPETFLIAQEITSRPDLHALFKEYRTLDANSISAMKAVLLAMQGKEGYNGDDPA